MPVGERDGGGALHGVLKVGERGIEDVTRGALLRSRRVRVRV